MSPSDQILWLLVLALLAPLASSMLALVLPREMNRTAGWITTGVMAMAFIACSAASYLWINTPGQGPVVWNIPWIPIPGTQAGWLYLGVMADSLTILMMTMVTLISTLVHLYAMGYMAGDKRFNRFFVYLSWFTFSMLGIVAANSLIMLMVFWELVGLTSYLLIGFWFEKKGPQQASKKAFVMNRVGDAGFLIGMGLLFYHLGGQLLLPLAGGESGNIFDNTLELLKGQGLSVTQPPLWLTVAGIALFFGAIGKSAQFPLHTWLPDAMEGPTPVSSIVHSATMVAAGVYLTARIYPILTPEAHLFIASIGLITLLIGACMAMVVTDIKRVLAYSTLSQIGYMILGMGAGAYVFALYHLVTHAFFKCCLFQCAGSVIHGAGHEQDMRQYGGLWRKMPITAVCYFICMLAIAGASIPMTAWGISGFYSKDGIIAGAVNYAHALEGYGVWTQIFWIGPVAVAYLTAFYMARSFALTFLGQPRNAHLHEHAHEAPWQMLVSQVMLAVLAILALPAMVLQPIQDSTPMVSYVQPDAVAAAGHGPLGYHQIELLMHKGFEQAHLYLGLGFGWLVMIVLGVALYWPGVKVSQRIATLPVVRLFYTLFINRFYFDALYDVAATGLVKLLALIVAGFDRFVVDGLVNGLAGGAVRLSHLAGQMDNNRPDRPLTASVAGSSLPVARPGRVRVYVLVMFLAGTLIMFAMVGLMVMYR
jgi:NADH-quinone oxidoreductase subunit L